MSTALRANPGRHRCGCAPSPAAAWTDPPSAAGLRGRRGDGGKGRWSAMKSPLEDAIFALALRKPAEKRAAFLDAMCEGDPALRQRRDQTAVHPPRPEQLVRGDDNGKLQTQATTSEVSFIWLERTAAHSKDALPPPASAPRRLCTASASRRFGQPPRSPGRQHPRRSTRTASAARMPWPPRVRGASSSISNRSMPPAKYRS